MNTSIILLDDDKMRVTLTGDREHIAALMLKTMLNKPIDLIEGIKQGTPTLVKVKNQEEDNEPYIEL